MLNSIKSCLLTLLHGNGWYWTPPQSIFQPSFAKLILFSAALAAFISPHQAEAKLTYPAAVISSTYSGTKLGSLCVNCHSNWGGGDVRYNNGSTYWIFEGGTGTSPAAGSQYYTLDEDMDGSSTNAEYINSQSSLRPAAAWQPGYPDKDGDGCIQLYYRSDEVGLPLQAINITGVGYVGGPKGYVTYGPNGWDIDDNDPSQGCSTAWPTSATPGAFINPGITSDNVPPARITDFRAEGRATSQISFAWTAVGDDGLDGVTHNYDLRYTTADIASSKNVCGVSGASACNVRLASDWEAMYDVADATFNGAQGMYIPKSGAVTTIPAGNKTNTGIAAPLMRAFFEPAPGAPGSTEQYILSSKGAAKPTNVITNGTLTYWAAIRASDGVLKVDHVQTPTTGFSENVSPISNIIAATAGPDGAAISSYTYYYGLSPDNGITYRITINGVGLDATNAARLVLIDNVSGAVVDEGTNLIYTGDTSVTGTFLCSQPEGTYTLEAVTDIGDTRAGWVGAVTVTPNLCAPAPVVTSINPASRGQGAISQDISIVGSEFVDGAVASFSGTGITVNSTTFESANTLTANISIVSGAGTGFRDITVTNPDMKSSTLSGGFTVLSGPSIGATSFPDGVVTVPYSHNMSASGGLQPYSWSATGLPPGLSINTSSGVISGTPTTLGTYGFSVRVTDENGGGATTGFVMVVLPNGPRVSNVSSGLANGVYTVGQVVPITVTFTKVSYVTGTPQLALATGPSTTTIANYSSGSGSTTLTFNYIVVAGNNSPDLDYASTTALVFNGSTIKDAENNNATLTLPAPGAAGSLGANKSIVIDTAAPIVTSAPVGGIYNSTRSVTLTANEPATIYYTVNGSTPTTASSVYSAPITISADTTLKYFAKDTATNSGAVVTQNYVIDTASPTVVGVSASLPNGTYYVGQIVPVTVTFSEVVNVSGTPKLTLATGNPAATAVNYSAGSGTTTLSFYYTVVTNNNSTDLDYNAATALSLNGGTIKDAALNNAVLTLAAPGAAGSLGANKDIVISTVASPRVTNVTSSTANGSKKAGAVVTILVTFTDPVTVTGAPQLVLATGTPATTAVNYSSGSGTATLTFIYTVVDGNNSADLDYASFDSIVLNGGTIKNAGGTNATLTLPFPGTAGSLAANKSIVIDTAAPVVTATPPGGIYNTTQSVVLSANEGANIYYTTNGSTPTSSSLQYSTPISISTDTTLQYFARDMATNNSAVVAQFYDIDTVPPEITAARSGGSNGDPLLVTLSSNEPATIYYTIDGSVPTVSSLVYSAPVEINFGTMLKYFGRDTAGNNSAVYILDYVPPVITAAPLGGGYNTTQFVSLTADEQANIFYTTDGSVPTLDSSGYMGQIEISEDATLNYFGVDTSGNISQIYTQIYIIDRTVPVVTPSLLGGLYYGAQTITLNVSEPTPIYYTLDGTTPTVSSTVYSSPILIPSDRILRYFAKDAAGNSGLGSQSYIISIVDLVMTDVSTTTTTIHVGKTFSISNTEKNQGSTKMTAASNTIKFYLSIDPVITSADIVLTGTRTVSALAAGVSSVGTTTVTVPGTMAPGTYYIGAIADTQFVQTEVNSFGTGETNNAMAGGTIVVIRDVDLIMTEVSSTTTTVGVGGSFMISNTEKNNGTTNMTVSSNTIKFYLSTDSTVTTTDIALTGTRSVFASALLAGTSSVGTTTVTVPVTTSPGTYTLGACADATNLQIETNADNTGETNNCLASGTVTVERDVDLVMTAVSTTATNVVAGTTFAIANTQKNEGTTLMTASSTTIKFYLSMDATVTTLDIALTGSRSVSPLSAGGTSSSSPTTTVTVPANTLAGTYTYGACADALDTEKLETRLGIPAEGNNCMAGGTITVLRDIDLVMSAVSSPDSMVGAGHTFTIANTELNQGNTPTTASNTIKFYLSTDGVISNTDIPLTTRVVSSLASGESSVASPPTVVTVPSLTAPGTYTFGACADALNTQTLETRAGVAAENNNCTAGGTITVVRDVDLVMSVVSTTSTTVVGGTTFQITNTETNNGSTMSTVSNTIKFYLSTDSVISTADLALTGSRSVPAGLMPGLSSSATTTVTVPGGILAGIYTYGACADALDTQKLETRLSVPSESAEGNNCTAGGTITILRDVDLVMSAVSSPATSVGAGHTFTIANTELNQGNTPTTASNTIKFYLSTDGVVTTADIALTGTRSVASLAAGASSTASPATTVTVPKLTAPGTYTFGACADALNAQTFETMAGVAAEDNNCTAGGTITVKRDVDLVMSAVSTTATSVARGATFTISSTETNDGSTMMTASGNTIKFFLSADSVITNGFPDIALTKTRLVTALLPGQSNTATTTVAVPSGIDVGTYTIGACADAFDTQKLETKLDVAAENNNCTAGGTITVY